MVKYRELLHALQELTADQLEYNVSIAILTDNHGTEEVTLMNVEETLLASDDRLNVEDFDLEEDLPLLAMRNISFDSKG